MKSIILYGLLITLLVSCSKYSFWETSKFHLDSTALSEGEKVRLIYFSKGPGDNEEREYYYHMIVVSQKTGDTVNILTTANDQYSLADNGKIFDFINDELIVKMSQLSVDEINNLQEKDLKDLKLKKIDKVARDPEYDYKADNNYPTVIGCIGTVTEDHK